MSPAVDLLLEPGLATVRPRGTRRAAAERFRGSEPALLVADAVRSSRCLRGLRAVDLRVVLETPAVLLRVRDAGAPTVPGGAGDDLAIVSGGAGPDGSVVDVGVPVPLIADVAEGLRHRRCWGPVRVELGPLVRLGRLLARAGTAVGGRTGLVLDVTRAAVTLLTVRYGGIRAGRAVPAGDLRAALLAVTPDLRAASSVEGSEGERPWVHLAVPPALEAGVRAELAGALAPGCGLDLLRIVGRRP